MCLSRSKPCAQLSNYIKSFEIKLKNNKHIERRCVDPGVHNLEYRQMFVKSTVEISAVHIVLKALPPLQWFSGSKPCAQLSNYIKLFEILYFYTLFTYLF